MTSTKDYGYLNTVEDIATYIGRVKAGGKVFGFDIESGYDGVPTDDISTTVFHPRWKLVGFSFTDSTDWARYVPIAHDTGQNAPVLAAARAFWSLLQTGQGVPHNASFELQGLSRWFREVLWDDTFLAEQVRASNGLFPVKSDSMIEAAMTQRYAPLNSGHGVGLGLKGLTEHIFNHKMIQLTDLFPDLKAAGRTDQLRFNILDFRDPRVTEYACEDSLWCLALHELHYPWVSDLTMFQIEILLLPILAEMEQEGLLLDWDEYDRRSIEILNFKNAMNEEIQEELSERLGQLVSVNFNSPKQVAELLYETLGLPTQYDPKTKRPTTGEKAVQKLVKRDPVVGRILEWREVGKLLSSYIEKYRSELHYADRAHPNHNQIGAGTGRFSVDHVSYQQWPKPYDYTLKDGTSLSLNYRNFLISPDEYRIVGFDFSQVELRVLAGMANETAMLDAFASGVDIHSATASQMMGIPLDKVTEKDRAKGKTLNFAIVYGSSAHGIAESLGISVDEAEELLFQYFETFSGLKTWMSAVTLEGQTTWEVSTMFGRRFHIWEYDDAERLQAVATRLEGEKKSEKLKQSRNVRSKGDRMCVNAPVQGGAADYLKIGMVRAQRAIKAAGMQDRIRMIMTIHDAIEFYVHDSVSTQEVIDLLNPCFSFPVAGLPEILAEWHEGKRWGEVIEVKVDKQKKITGYEYKKTFYSNIEEAYIAQYEQSGVRDFQEKEDYQYVLAFREAPMEAEWVRAKRFLMKHVSEDGKPMVIRVAGDEKALDGNFSLTIQHMAHIRNNLLSQGLLTLEKVS